MRTGTWGVVVMGMVALAGCGGAGGGGVPVKVQARQAAVAAAPVTVQDAGGATVVLDAAALSVRRIDLELPDGTRCADVEADLAGGATCRAEDRAGTDDHPRDEIRVEGPFVIDLLAGTAEPDISQVRVPDLAYEELKIRLGEALDGAGFTLSGTVDGAPLAVRLRGEDIEIEKPGGVRTSPGAPLLVELDAAAWFAALDLAACGGSVTVDDRGEDTCDLADRLERGLGGSADLDREDGHGGHGGDDPAGDDRSGRSGGL